MDTTVRPNDWLDERWRASAHEWIAARLDELGTPLTGTIDEVRVRPWSVTHRAPTGAGLRWFKANTPGCAYEAALAEALGRWVPDAVLAPLAVDTERGWLLTADAGATLREVTGPERRLETWAEMLAAYAALQRELAPSADAMVAMGVPDLRPAVMPDHLASLLDDPRVRQDLGPERLASIGTAEFRGWCEELGADGVAAGLQHDDLTDANVFPAPHGFRFFDWGDASVAHPFGSLLVALGFAGHVLDLGPGAPELLRLRDAYLEPWSDLAPPATLRRSASLACRVARVSRAVAWRRALEDAALPVEDDFRTAVADWLAEVSAPPVV